MLEISGRTANVSNQKEYRRSASSRHSQAHVRHGACRWPVCHNLHQEHSRAPGNQVFRSLGMLSGYGPQAPGW